MSGVVLRGVAYDCGLTVDLRLATVDLIRRGFRRDHVIQLAPLRRRHAAAVAPPAFTLAGTIGRPAPLPHPPVPDDLHGGIVGEGAAQQLEGGELATPHDDES